MRSNWNGLSVDDSSGPFLFVTVCGRWGGYRPYFENYTVDASIFETIFDRFVIDDLKDH